MVKNIDSKFIILIIWIFGSVFAGYLLVAKQILAAPHQPPHYYGEIWTRSGQPIIKDNAYVKMYDDVGNERYVKTGGSGCITAPSNPTTAHEITAINFYCPNGGKLPCPAEGSCIIGGSTHSCNPGDWVCDDPRYHCDYPGANFDNDFAFAAWQSLFFDWGAPYSNWPDTPSTLTQGWCSQTMSVPGLGTRDKIDKTYGCTYDAGGYGCNERPLKFTAYIAGCSNCSTITRNPETNLEGCWAIEDIGDIQCDCASAPTISVGSNCIACEDYGDFTITGTDSQGYNAISYFDLNVYEGLSGGDLRGQYIINSGGLSVSYGAGELLDCDPYTAGFQGWCLSGSSSGGSGSVTIRVRANGLSQAYHTGVSTVHSTSGLTATSSAGCNLGGSCGNPPDVVSITPPICEGDPFLLEVVDPDGASNISFVDFTLDLRNTNCPCSWMDDCYYYFKSVINSGTGNATPTTYMSICGGGSMAGGGGCCGSSPWLKFKLLTNADGVSCPPSYSPSSDGSVCYHNTDSTRLVLRAHVEDWSPVDHLDSDLKMYGRAGDYDFEVSPWEDFGDFVVVEGPSVVVNPVLSEDSISGSQTSAISWDGSSASGDSYRMICTQEDDPEGLTANLGSFCSSTDYQYSGNTDSAATIISNNGGQEGMYYVFLEHSNICGTVYESDQIEIANNPPWMMTSWGDTFAQVGYSMGLLDVSSPSLSLIQYGTLCTTSRSLCTDWSSDPEYFSNYIQSWNAGVSVAATRWILGNGYADANKTRWYPTSGDTLYDKFKDLAAKNGFAPVHPVPSLSDALNRLPGDNSAQLYEYISDQSISMSDQCNSRSVILINGNLDIEPGSDDGNNPTGMGIKNQGAACVFIVSGNITIASGNDVSNPSYDMLNSFFISDSTFDTESDGDDGLFINGGVVSSQVSFDRDVDNLNRPAEAIRYDPRYFELLREVLGQDYSYSVREKGYTE